MKRRVKTKSQGRLMNPDRLQRERGRRRKEGEMDRRRERERL